MSELQNKTKPLLSPLIKGQTSISWGDNERFRATAWATMMVNIMEFAHPRLACTTPLQRATFMNEIRPISRWQIWISSITEPAPCEFHLFAAGVYKTASVPRYADATTNIQSATFTIGHLAVHTFSCQEELSQDAVVANYAVSEMAKLWPYDGDLNKLRSLAPFGIAEIAFRLERDISIQGYQSAKQ